VSLPVFKTGAPANPGGRVRFPSASASAFGGLAWPDANLHPPRRQRRLSGALEFPSASASAFGGLAWPDANLHPPRRQRRLSGARSPTAEEQLHDQQDDPWRDPTECVTEPPIAG
jgi:hypothetical protein